jgi:hypothetical protein
MIGPVPAPLGEEPDWAPAAAPATLRITTWRDEVVASVGVDPRSRYVETFWLPILGPSATWLMRRLADGLDEAPNGYEVNVADLGRALGLGGGTGRSSPLRRAVQRCIRFDLARQRGEDLLAVRRLVAPLPKRHLLRMPPAVVERHDRWEVERSKALPEAIARWARLLALDLVQLGEVPDKVERQLVRWGISSDLAGRATRWASSRSPGGSRATS